MVLWFFLDFLREGTDAEPQKIAPQQIMVNKKEYVHVRARDNNKW